MCQLSVSVCPRKKTEKLLIGNLYNLAGMVYALPNKLLNFGNV